MNACPCCPKSGTIRFLLKHCWDCHKEKELAYSCKICKQDCPKYKAFKNHMQYSHQVYKTRDTDPHLSIISNEDRILQCSTKRKSPQLPNGVTRSVAKLSLQLSSEQKLSIKGVQDVVQGIARILKYSRENENESIQEELIGTDCRRKKFYRQNFLYVPPQIVFLGKGYKENGIAKKIVFRGFHVPLKESISSLLSIPQYSKYCSMTSSDWDDHSKGFWYSEPGQIPTIFLAASFDEIEIVNPIGMHRGVHKCFVGLYEVLNVPPILRSVMHAKQLLFVCKKSHIKSGFGFRAIFRDFVDTLKIGTQPIALGPEGKLFYIKLSYITADTPASNFISGTFESVGSAVKFCRRCYCSRDERSSIFDDRLCCLRNLSRHLGELNRIENASKAESLLLQSDYGIRRRSPLLAIPNFNLDTIVFDPMHIILEAGVLANSLQWLLHDLIIHQNLFTLDELNFVLARWEFDPVDKGDQPRILDDSFVNPDATINITAKSLYVLAQEMLFMISNWVDNDSTAILNFARLLHICQFILFAPEIHEESLTSLRFLITLHHTIFVQTYPQANVKPKAHFMLHFPDQMLKLGPARYQSCMRYEAHYSVFKGKNWRNFKSIQKSLAEYHQRWITNYYVDEDGSLRNDILQTLSFKRKGEKTFQNFLISVRFEHLLDRQYDTVFQSLQVGSSRFTEGTIIEVSAPTDGYPEFGRIDRFLAKDEQIFVCIDIFTSAWFEPKYASWRVEGRCATILEFNSNFYHLILPSRKVDDRLYVIRKSGSCLEHF